MATDLGPVRATRRKKNMQKSPKKGDAFAHVLVSETYSDRLTHTINVLNNLSRKMGSICLICFAS